MSAFLSVSAASGLSGLVADSSSAPSIVDEALAPFRGLDITSLYAQYSTVVDFVLFLVLFWGVARLSLGKQFPGAPGRWISGSVAVALALGLVVAEKTMGFGVASMGPIAASILVLVVGVTLFLSIRQLAGVGALGAVGITFVVVYLVMQAAVPGYFGWLKDKVPFVGAVFAVALLLALWKGGTYVVGAFRGRARGQPEDETATREETPQERTRGGEWMAREAEADTGAAARDLSGARRLLEQGNPTMDDLARCMALLRDASGRESRVAESLDRVRALARRAEALSKSDVMRIRFQVHSLSPREQRALGDVLRFEGEELKVEHAVTAIAQEAERLVAVSRQATEAAQVAVRQGQLPEAHRRVVEAFNAERAVGRLVYRLEQMEQGLIRLVSSEANVERAAAVAHAAR